MEQKWYATQELAQILKLHPKTILRFIHENKIKAQKIGRSWRVSQQALKEYAHGELAVPVKTDNPVDFGSLNDRMKVSAVIEINEQNSVEASRLSNTLLAALNCKDPDWGNARFDFLYYPEIQKAKYVLYGSPEFIREVMMMLESFSKIERNEK
ncbi:MAG: helix-turn-helix domain-containing protein [Sphaerochaetaceae bacterium]|nr:helix-turn-helix domain-containing protein [Sphaerochaetaceae bacterium]NLV84147.1 helix-turn-helix domain-containing protein [Spirochaetales bacterium]